MILSQNEAYGQPKKKLALLKSPKKMVDAGKNQNDDKEGKGLGADIFGNRGNCGTKKKKTN